MNRNMTITFNCVIVEEETFTFVLLLYLTIMKHRFESVVSQAEEKSFRQRNSVKKALLAR